MKRAVSKTLASRVYANYSWDLLTSVSAKLEEVTHPFFTENKTGKTLIVLITSNRGLCGAYNSQVIKKTIIKILTHCLVLSFWYLLMLAIFGKAFFWQHIFESHFRRVTSSIEFHFGERTYYITLALQQMGMFFYLGIVGGLVTLIRFFRNFISSKEVFFSFYLLSWFIFLNLTKTKIFWYFYPAIPQFAFLAVFWLKQIDKKIVRIVLGLLLVAILCYQSNKQNVLATSYSKPESYYHLALYAKDHCQSIDLLINKTSRQSFATLDKMGLLITTTKWWGEHPSMVYYFRKKINFYYDLNSYSQSFQKSGCFVIDKNDGSFIDKKYKNIKYGDYYLIMK